MPVSFEESQSSNPDYTGFDHLTWYVGNALQSASFFITRYGFEPVAYRGPETGSHLVACYVVRNGRAVMQFMAPVADSNIIEVDARASATDRQLARDIHEHLSRHGDGVKDIAFQVTHVAEVWAHAVRNGAQPVQLPVQTADEKGEVCWATIGAYGDTTHTLINRSQYRGDFLPGYLEVAGSDGINKVLPPIDLVEIDHCVGIQLSEGLDEVVKYYETAFNFRQYWPVDDTQMCSAYSAMRSVVMASPNKVIKMPMNKPAVGVERSQIEEFVDYYNGAGCQHIAFRTGDIIQTVDHLSKRGVLFLEVPRSYYSDLKKRLGEKHESVSARIELLQRYNIFVDFDESGYLLQIFAKHITDRPTVFIEIIQRENFDGFGAGDFKSLFEASEREQAGRKNL
ncbi:hypothetical protein ASPZODRAFT_65754 [Penicilliopsis zonata CBS 506.65]|uniref:4-hydroxyphenylpyruvate dioxygenase n=1 Tax=Penicilliopsis zonata CBS 506.65 TaxID=1073090 RepID=A0A1L9SID3_9EURO|nr:hypothetical protein ASPZODRAFT_65754 [Penicilliopsis zonata CBS 506.65]OJJ46843.1 hypothetical protein ASPZODRAFT_65754 [Penicilliopsis zonata CBS 506.65]